MKLIYIVASFFIVLVPLTGRSQPPTSVGRGAEPGYLARLMQPPEPTPLDDPEEVPIPEPVDRGPSGLGLPELEQMALQYNPTLSQALARVEEARGIWQQVGLYPNPVAGYVAEEMGDDYTAGKQGGFIGQEFVFGGKLRLNRQVACQEVVRREQQYAAQQFRVLTHVRTTFYDVLLAQRRVELTERLVNIAGEGTKAADQLLKAKEASRVDLLQARIEANKAKILRENAQKQYEGGWRALAAVVGVPDMAPVSLSGDVDEVGPPLTWEDAMGQLLSQSPELAAASARLEGARWSSQRARVEWIPNVAVRASVQHDNASGDDVAGLEVAVPLPLFDRNQGNIVAANSNVMAAERNMERLQLSLQNRLARVFRLYAMAHQQYANYRDSILPDAKETLDLVTAGYRQGEFSYLTLLTAQRTYFESNLTYLDSLLDLKASRASIEGFLLTEGLSEPDEGQ